MDKSTRNWMIGLGVGTVALIILYYAYQKTNKGLNKKPTILEFDTETSNGMIITTPKSKFSSYDVVVVFGGIDFATPVFMKQELESSKANYLLYSNIFIFVPYNAKWEDVEMKINRLREVKKINSVSLIGYSAGGTDVQERFGGNYRFIGLIDPSTNERFVKPYASNVAMVYNDLNWSGKYDYIGKLLPRLSEAITNSGGSAERVNLKHREIPKYFFEKYSQQING